MSPDPSVITNGGVPVYIGINVSIGLPLATTIEPETMEVAVGVRSEEGREVVGEVVCARGAAWFRTGSVSVSIVGAGPVRVEAPVKEEVPGAWRGWRSMAIRLG